MIARRLSRWLGRVFSTVCSAFRSTRTSVSEPVTVAAGNSDRVTKSTSLSSKPKDLNSDYDARSGSWVNDGQRLRPSASARSDAALAPRVEPVQRVTPATSPEPLIPAEPPRRTGVSRPVNLDEPAVEQREAPFARLLSLAASGRDPRAADLDLEGLSAVERRLVLLRYLVRQRVYNEGFSRERTPSQYHRSLGISDGVAPDDE